MRQRLVVEVGDAGMQLEIVEAALDVDRAAREQLHAQAGLAGEQGRGQLGHHGQGGGDDADGDPPAQRLAGTHQLLLERVAVGQDPLRPGQHPLALLGQALEPVAALDHEHAQILLEMPQARRKRRLRHAARLGRAGEMPLAGEGHEVAELPDVHDGPLLPCGVGCPTHVPVRCLRRMKRSSMAIATMTSKGRLTLPKEIREQRRRANPRVILSSPELMIEDRDAVTEALDRFPLGRATSPTC